MGIFDSFSKGFNQGRERARDEAYRRSQPNNLPVKLVEPSVGRIVVLFLFICEILHLTKQKNECIIKIENESHRNVCYHINYDKTPHSSAKHNVVLLLFAQNYYYCNNQGKCYNSHFY